MSYQNNKNKKSNVTNWKEKFNPKWITVGFDKETDKFSDEIGKFLSIQLSSSQIRNIFGELKRIEMSGFVNEKTAFILLKSKFMKATAKDRKLEPLKDIFYLSYDLIETENIKNGEIQFMNFMNLFEAIINYFTGYKGK